MSQAANLTYGDWLRERMSEKGLSQRQLGTKLTPQNPEIGRRSVRRYLKGTTPILRTREAVSAALGTDDLGPGSPEDEEDDLVVQALLKLDEVYVLLQQISAERGLGVTVPGPGQRLLDDLGARVVESKPRRKAAA